jgi:hypothetical protein
MDPPSFTTNASLSASGSTRISLVAPGAGI